MRSAGFEMWYNGRWLMVSLCLMCCFHLSSSSVASLGDSLQFSVDMTTTTEWDHYWERCVGSGHALLGLRHDWREHLAKAHKDLGFQLVRFHGLFDDDMSVDLDGYYSWYNVDSVFDFLLSIGMKPLVELSFMPEDIASGTDTIFHYKGNITPPKNWTDWYNLIQLFVHHIIERYGQDEIRSWHFETWNEPNCGFWTGTKSQYFTLLQVTSSAIKDIDSQLSVGGPATCQSQWLNDTLEFVKENNVAIDFISTHEYPTDISPLQRGIMKKVLSQSRQIVGDMPLFYTEYNDGLFAQSKHDTTYASAFAIQNIIDCAGIVEIFSWWTFTDIFEEGGFVSTPFHEGYGLQIIYGVPKPAYRAFELLHQTGNKRAAVDDYDYPTADIAVLLNGTHVMILMVNHNVPNATIATETFEVTLSGVSSPRSQSGMLRRIDEDNANPIKTWQTMGSPEYPTKKEIHALMQASEMKAQSIKATNVGKNIIMFSVDIPPEGVAAITFSLQ